MSRPETADLTTAPGWDAHAADYARHFSPLTGHFAPTMVTLIQARLPGEPRLLDIAADHAALLL